MDDFIKHFIYMGCLLSTISYWLLKRKKQKLEQENQFHINCIVDLLTGLNIQNIGLFMNELTPENCFKLGNAYRIAAINKINENKNEPSNHKV
jgi:hypothetical protein